MSMQLRVDHTTVFDYDSKAAASYNMARLTPVTTPDQIVVHSRLEISPKPWTFEYRDYFGTAVTAFEVVDPHDAMTVHATSTVQTTREPGQPPVLDWTAIAGREVNDRWTEYLVLPDRVVPPGDFAARVKQLAADHELPGDAARAVCALVHDEIEFSTAATSVDSPAATAWQRRTGVCQDLVHLAVGGLRSVGIPARYVSGYAHPDLEPVIGAATAGAPHAWVEWWDDGWRGFDLASATDIDDRHVQVAAGRDVTDVRPISGIYAGPEDSEVSVTVEITRLA